MPGRRGTPWFGHIFMFLALSLLLGSSAVQAGGPLILFDEATRTPIFYPVGTVDIYTDLGTNGPLSKARSDTLVEQGFAEWTAVPTSHFAAAVAGDILVGGVPTDITLANADSIFFQFNGGGIHVVSDTDGSIILGYFGAPLGVAGLAQPEFTDTGSPEILESFVVLNGSLIDPGDPNGDEYAGVYTHEFGHAINLAHTQTNGAIVFFSDNDGASGCVSLGGTPSLASIETMYPFIDPTPGSSGTFQATVDLLDDIAALSDLYPAAGWPNTTGTITGTIFMPDSVTEVTGVNVIARNLADPMGDANSALSGDYTLGALGPDGLYTLTGLTPGADYAVYVDQIEDGGFSTPPTGVAFFEEYWNGAGESGDVDADTACAFVPITAVAGVSVTADIYLNVDPSVLVIGDQDAVQLALPFSFPFCGTSYDSVWVGSNGFVTFDVGDVNGASSVTGLLVGPPRIAGLWTDLTPDLGGSVSAKEVNGNFEIRWTAVPEFFIGGSNTFTITLRPDGSHRIHYGQTTSFFQTLAGRSPGGGAVDPGATDLTAAAQPLGRGAETVYEAFILGDDLSGADLEFASCGQVTAVPDPGVTPGASALLQCRPNPFRSSTLISFDLAAPGAVRLQIIDIRGRLVRTLVDDHLDNGRYSIPWLADDTNGRIIRPGIYFYRLKTPSFEDSHKVIRIR